MRVNASREAVFGEEEVSVKKVAFPDDKSRFGTMTGATLAGYCEVEMPNLDGKKHWYPIEGVLGENGERLLEEEIQIEDPEDEDEEQETK